MAYPQTQKETPAGQGGGDEAMCEGSQGKVNRSGGMEIVRAPRKGQFEVIPHSVLRDSRLSYRARGVLGRLLSNAPGYRMAAEALAREGVEGRDAIKAALRELEAAGYLLRRRRRDEKGRWHWLSFVTDTPFAFEGLDDTAIDGFPVDGFPDHGNPVAGEPVVGFQGVNSTTKTSTNSLTKPSTSTNQHVAVSASKNKGRNGGERPEVMHGLYCFGDRDRGQIAELVRDFGASSVERAARHVTKLDSRGRTVAFVSEARHWLTANSNSAAKHLTDIAEVLGRSMSMGPP
ncbi:phage replication protein [Xanthomonas sp. D-36-1]|uniref:phage replication protein n=2 Tax=Xanthomonas TaxID=338 RepID=UPI000B1E5B6D|nr:phage replication protein [Xanthomonas sp. D-36-1]